MTLDDRVKISGDVVYQAVGEELVLLNLRTGFYYGLDQVGSRTWVLLAEHGSLRAAFQHLVAEYDVAPEELRQDLLRLVQELQAKRLVEPAD